MWKWTDVETDTWVKEMVTNYLGHIVVKLKASPKTSKIKR